MGIVVIGASFGGVEALEEVLRGLNSPFTLPVAIVLHRSPESGPLLKSVLQKHTDLRVIEPHDKERLEPGAVYVAPAGYHMLVEDGHAALSTEGPVAYARPSVDVLFESAADSYAENTVAVILTGQNTDGAKGAARIKRRGGKVIVQNPETSASRSMPDAVIKTTGVDHIVELEEVAPMLNRLAAEKAQVQ